MGKLSFTHFTDEETNAHLGHLASNGGPVSQAVYSDPTLSFSIGQIAAAVTADPLSIFSSFLVFT